MHANPEKSKRILLVDKDQTLLDIMRRFLSQSFRVHTADSVDNALAHLAGDSSFDLVLTELDLGKKSGLDLITQISHNFPQLRTALMANSRMKVDQYLHGFRRLHVYQVLIKNVPFDFDEFLTSVENVLYPAKALGLARYMREPMRLWENNLRTRHDKAEFVEEACRLFRRWRQFDSDVTEIRLVLEEVVNNAFYHAFQKSNGTEKYKPGSFSELDLSESVIGRFARDNFFLGFSVTDNAGSLDPSTVMAKLERQMTLEGLMDENGRGMFLTRNLSDRCIINIRPGRLTEMIVLFRHEKAPCAKPLQINILND